MNLENFFDRAVAVTAIVGCITGIAGLIIQFIQALANRPKVKLKDYANNLCGFYPNYYNEKVKKERKFSGEHIIIVGVKIVNLKDFPVSLSNISLQAEDNEIYHYPNYELPEKICFPETKQFLGYQHKSDTILLPHRFDSMETYNGVFVFPNADLIYQKYLETGNPIDATITFEFNHKTLKHKVLLSEVTAESTDADKPFTTALNSK